MAHPYTLKPSLESRHHLTEFPPGGAESVLGTNPFRWQRRVRTATISFPHGTHGLSESARSVRKLKKNEIGEPRDVRRSGSPNGSGLWWRCCEVPIKHDRGLLEGTGGHWRHLEAVPQGIGKPQPCCGAPKSGQRRKSVNAKPVLQDNRQQEREKRARPRSE